MGRYHRPNQEFPPRPTSTQIGSQPVPAVSRLFQPFLLVLRSAVIPGLARQCGRLRKRLESQVRFARKVLSQTGGNPVLFYERIQMLYLCYGVGCGVVLCSNAVVARPINQPGESRGKKGERGEETRSPSLSWETQRD